jgi:hypothetical protein
MLIHSIIVDVAFFRVCLMGTGQYSLAQKTKKDYTVNICYSQCNKYHWLLLITPKVTTTDDDYEDD